MSKGGQNAFGGTFRREHRLKKKRLRIRKRESLSPSLLTQSQAFRSSPGSSSSGSTNGDGGRARTLLLFILLYSRAARPRPPLAPPVPLLSLPARIPRSLKKFQPRAHPSFPPCFLAHPFRAKRFKHNARRRCWETLRILLAHVFPLGIASSVFQAFQAF